MSNFIRSAPFVLATLPIVASANDANREKSNQKLPNVIVIYMDDMGYGDLEVNGASGYKTPNLNRITAEGMLFTNFYTSQAVSSASRAAIMTGCYSNRVGILGALFPQSTIGLNPEETTIAEIFKQKNYKTAIIGKWHLGYQKEFLPLQQGFDEYFGIPYSNDMWPRSTDGMTPAKPGSGVAKHPPLPLIEGNDMISTIEDMEAQDKLTTMYTERAVEFIKENRNDPFFLYIPHAMVHIPLAVSEKFRGKSELGIYGDVMMEVDWSVGEIMGALKKYGVDQNTLIVFSSDNGPWLNFGSHSGSAGGLREGKGSAWEGGQRIPCVMWWKGKIEGGSVCHNIASTIDLLPTFADIIGADLPQKKIDGVSILQLIKGEDGDPPREYFVYYYGEDLIAIRNDQWKLVFPHKYRSYGVGGENGNPAGARIAELNEMSLYDMRLDRGERINVITKHPEVVKELDAMAGEYRRELGDALTATKGSGIRKPGEVSKF